MFQNKFNTVYGVKAIAVDRLEEETYLSLLKVWTNLLPEELP